MMKKQLFSCFFVLFFLFAFCLSVHSVLVWNECEVLEKASDLNAECYFGSVRVHGEEVDSLVVLSYQEYYGNIDLEDSVQSALQDQVFNNKSFEDNGVTYNGFGLVGLAGNAEFLVNEKYLKINIYGMSSCTGYTQPNYYLIAVGALLVILSLALAFVTRVKSDKGVRLALLILGILFLVFAIALFVLLHILFIVMGLVVLVLSIVLFFLRRIRDRKKVTRILKSLVIGLLILAVLLIILAQIFRVPGICF